MKIRILSDLHVDINNHYGSIFKWEDRDVLTVLAGDTSGDLKTTAEFVRKHFNNAILIGGNHIVYNEEGKTIQQLHSEYRAEFPLDTSISFLENDYKIIDDVVFIGATLWTDYKYSDDQSINMHFAAQSMNDFRWGSFAGPTGLAIPLRPDHCLSVFQDSMKFIQETYDRFINTDKKIVLIVHHGISPQAIAREHRGSHLNAAYISDLEEYITQNMPRLALIIHGHVHHRIQYKIGDIPVICNPFGYAGYGENKTDPKWEKNLIVDI
jgi:predicted phosphodiesterase